MSKGTFGHSKHRKSGSSVNSTHFTGKKGGKLAKRKSTNKKLRRKKRGTHVNKYANKVGIK